PSQPVRLQRVDAPRAVARQEALDVVVRRRRDRPERAARAVAWKPVRRDVLVVDRPDERLGRVVLRIRPRLEALDPAVVADVPDAHRRWKLTDPLSVHQVITSAASRPAPHLRILLRELGNGRRFSELHVGLATVTPRALALALQELE